MVSKDRLAGRTSMNAPLGPIRASRIAKMFRAATSKLAIPTLSLAFLLLIFSSSYCRCSCNSGYRLSADQHSCIRAQVDPKCSNVVCLNGGSCKNGLCQCKNGFGGSSCQVSRLLLTLLFWVSSTIKLLRNVNLQTFSKIIGTKQLLKLKRSF